MNTEQERAAFEWWASDEGQSPRATERVGGCYKLAQIQSYWMAWQARAALQAENEKLCRDAERYRWLRADNAYFPEENYIRGGQELDAAIDAAMQPAPNAPTFQLGDRVRKTKGSQWKGRVVGTYSTSLTPEGYAVESDTEKGSVQIYPVGALERVPPC